MARENTEVDGSGGDPKGQLRAQLLAKRRARSDADLARARAGLVDVVLARAAACGWRRVAAYEALRTEPGSPGLLEALSAAGIEVLVPITLAAPEQDWEPWPGRGALGRDALAGVDAVLAPALAVGRDGSRLGRGRGYYDRALQRCGPDVAVAALVFDDEVRDTVPVDPWDRPVGAAATPSAWVPLRNTRVAPDR